MNCLTDDYGNKFCIQRPESYPVRSKYDPRPTPPTPPTPPMPPTPPVPPPPIPPTPPGPPKPPGPPPPPGPPGPPKGPEQRDKPTNHWNLKPLTTFGSKFATASGKAVYGKGAKKTLDKLPRQGKIAGELLNVGYDLVGKYGRTTNNVSMVPTNAFTTAMETHLSDDTKSFVGELLPQYSDSNILIFKRADGHLTAAVRGTHTGSLKEVGFDAKKIALMDNAARSSLFEKDYFSVLRKVKQDFGKSVDVIMGDSLGGHISISATDAGLASRSVALNPYIRPSSIGNGHHTILRTERDIALISRENALNMSNSTESALAQAGKNTTIDIVPSSQTNSLNPLRQIGHRVEQHSIDNFIPEKTGIPLEEGDSFLPNQRLLNIRNFERQAEETARAAGSNRYNLLAEEGEDVLNKIGKSGITKVATSAAKLGRGVGLNVVGAIATDKILDAAGVENEYVHDVVSGVGGGLVEGAAVGGGSALLEGGAIGAAAGAGAIAALPVALAGGIGVAEADYLANRLHIEGAGKVGLEVGGGVANSALAAVAISNFWNPFGWVSMGIMAAEGIAVGIDAATHHEHNEKLDDQK